MKRILVRSGKSPFELLSKEASLAANGWGVFGANSGNLLFQLSAFKTFSTPNSEVYSDSLYPELGKLTDEEINIINQKFDLYVIPLANAFRESFVKSLNNLTIFINKLNIPVVVLGVGAQVKLSENVEAVSEKVNKAVRDFLNAVLEKSNSIGVRGEFTRDYLLSLNFPSEKIKIIGCPSLYLYGKNLEIKKSKLVLDSFSKVSINVTPSVTKTAGIIDHSVKNYSNLEYIAQEHTDLAMMIWGEERGRPKDSRIPIHLDHDLYLNNKMRFFIDAIPWIHYLQDKDFSFGSRIHGNIASILAKTPAVVIVHDSRTQELVDFHSIPFIHISKINNDTTVQELYNLVDYRGFNEQHPHNFNNYINFLNDNNLEHIFKEQYQEYESYFDKRINELEYPPVVEVSRFGDNVIDDIFTKLRWLRQSSKIDKNRKNCGAYHADFLIG